MAKQIPDLCATIRTGTGKGAARQARRDGLVPGVVYGGNQAPIAINIPFSVLFKKLKEKRFLSTLFNLKIDGAQDVRVICRNVQRDVVKDLPVHLDLMRLQRASRVNLFIPVEFINEQDAPGIKRGGVLTIVRPEVELRVTAGEIPEKLVVDLTGLNVGDTVTISSVELPEGARTTIDRDFVIANISAPSGLRSSEEGAETDAEGAEEAEGEEGASE